MTENELEVGKYYRNAGSNTLKKHVGVVFRVDGVEETGRKHGRIRHFGAVVYTPRDIWTLGKTFYTEDFDIYEEISDEEVTVYLLAD